MLSRSLDALADFLNLAATAIEPPSQQALGCAYAIAIACRDEAQHLEATIVPRRQRLDTALVDDGKVLVFPKVPKPEAFT